MATRSANLREPMPLDKWIPLLTKLGAIYRIWEEGVLADGLEELHADEVHVTGVLLSFNTGLNRRHAGGNQR
jgi:hypothetical protein